MDHHWKMKLNVRETKGGTLRIIKETILSIGVLVESQMVRIGNITNQIYNRETKKEYLHCVIK